MQLCHKGNFVIYHDLDHMPLFGPSQNT